LIKALQACCNLKLADFETFKYNHLIFINIMKIAIMVFLLVSTLIINGCDNVNDSEIFELQQKLDKIYEDYEILKIGLCNLKDSGKEIYSECYSYQNPGSGGSSVTLYDDRLEVCNAGSCSAYLRPNISIKKSEKLVLTQECTGCRYKIRRSNPNKN